LPIVSTRSVILQTYRYSDTSKILRLMTRRHGPRSAIAKGALRPKSKFGGVLEPFAEGEATLYLKENRDLHTLSEFELIRDRQRLGLDLPRFTGASLACELVMRLAPEERDDRLYRTLLDALDALLEAEGGQVERVALSAVWRVVRILGFTPELRACVSCGRVLEEDGARFDFSAGGLVCGHCPRGDGPGRWLEPDELRTLRMLEGGRPLEAAADSGTQPALLRDFIRYHLAEGTSLRSLEFLDPRTFGGR